MNSDDCDDLADDSGPFASDFNIPVRYLHNGILVLIAKSNLNIILLIDLDEVHAFKIFDVINWVRSFHNMSKNRLAKRAPWLATISNNRLLGKG